MSTVPTKALPSGDELPMVGLGTWNLSSEAAASSTRAAIEAGYTHIDTAEGYSNESGIGDVIAEYDREELFLTSKVLPKNLGYERVLRSCRDSLENLGTEYLDLYLIHWPNPAISLRETLDAMATLHDRGLVRNVGVSNFSAYQLSCAHHISDVPIAVNQIEFHPYYRQPELTEYCRETETVVEAAAPLARTEVLDDPVVKRLAEAYDRTPAQIVLRWAIGRDAVVLPKSASTAHIESNFQLLEWDIDDEDAAAIDEIHRDEPVYHTPTNDWSRDVYGISR